MMQATTGMALEPRLVTETGLAARCAWCGRYRVGDRWLPLGEVPEHTGADVSHGICPDCVAALRNTGKSA